MSSRTLSANSTNVRKMIGLGWHRLRFAVGASLWRDKAVEAATQLFMTPPRHAHTSRELEVLALSTPFTVAAAGAQLSAWRFGRADHPAIVFSHGWGGRGAQFRAFVPRLLEAGYQAIVFDHEGHGRSTGRQSSLVHFARGLEAVVAHVEAGGAKVAGLVGHSLGAAAIGAYLDGGRADLRAVLIAPPTSIARWAGAFARRLGIPATLRDEIRARLERRVGRRLEDFELPRAVANANAAALVIHDQFDPDVPVASGVALARAWRGARLAVTRGLGHHGVLRDPEVVQDALDFLADRVVFQPPPAPGEPSAFLAPAAVF